MRKSKYDWEKLLTDTEIYKEYSISVRNSFAALADLDANTDCDTLYSSLVTAHENAAEETLPLKPKKKKHVAWLVANVQKKRQAVKSAHATQLAKPTENNKNTLKSAKDELQETYTSCQTNYIQEKKSTQSNQHQFSNKPDWHGKL